MVLVLAVGGESGASFICTEVMPLESTRKASALAAMPDASAKITSPAVTPSETRSGMPPTVPPLYCASGQAIPPTLSPTVAMATARSGVVIRNSLLAAPTVMLCANARTSSLIAAALAPLDGMLVAPLVMIARKAESVPTLTALLSSVSKYLSVPSGPARNSSFESTITAAILVISMSPALKARLEIRLTANSPSVLPVMMLVAPMIRVRGGNRSIDGNIRSNAEFTRLWAKLFARI